MSTVRAAGHVAVLATALVLAAAAGNARPRADEARAERLPRSARGSAGGRRMATVQPYRASAFVGIDAFRDWQTSAQSDEEQTLLSRELRLPIGANELVLSWNIDAASGSGAQIDVRALYPGRATRWYCMGRWSPDGLSQPRESVKGQKDADGDVQTDTLVLHQVTDRIQVRITLRRAPEGRAPALKFLGISAVDTLQSPPAQPAHRAAWGREIVVPGRSQLGWPEGKGWCSPTSTDMALAYWSLRLGRPELDLPVPEAAHAVYDRVYDGTGNWPFNTAFAGSFPGMRAYVTRFSDIRELEEWVTAGIPPIVSVSYDYLKGKETSQDPGHLMVCVGFTSDGSIVLNDPAYHPERGEVCRRVFNRSNFLRAWAHSRQTVYLIYPVGAKIPANRYGTWERTH